MSLRLGIYSPVARVGFDRLLRPLSQVSVQWVTPAELPQAAAHVDALVLPAADYSRDLAKALEHAACSCRWLQLLTAGYETLQIHGVPERVAVTNAGAVWSPMVAEHAIALMLMMARRAPLFLAAQAEARWDNTIREDMSMLFDAQLVIVGMGSIGAEIARRSRAFGMRVIGVNRSGRPHAEADRVVPVSQLNEALNQADFVVCAVPGAAENTGLIGTRELASCPSHSVIVNVGRGNVVDLSALLKALKSGSIAGAALDVTDPEPLPSDHPLWREPNVIISPHLGGAAPERYYDRLARHVAGNLQARLAGEPLKDIVNLNVSI